MNQIQSSDHENNEPLSKERTNPSSHNDSYHLGYGPLAHVNTAQTTVPPFAGELQPGLYRPPTDRKIANPVPLGLGGFALTTFVAGLINLQVRGITEPNLVIGAAFAYGGLVQLCAGMWYVIHFTCAPSMDINSDIESSGIWRPETHLEPRLCPLMADFGSPLLLFLPLADSISSLSWWKPTTGRWICTTTQLGYSSW